jgi:hypothetical protein
MKNEISKTGKVEGKTAKITYKAIATYCDNSWDAIDILVDGEVVASDMNGFDSKADAQADLDLYCELNQT